MVCTGTIAYPTFRCTLRSAPHAVEPPHGAAAGVIDETEVRLPAPISRAARRQVDSAWKDVVEDAPPLQ